MPSTSCFNNFQGVGNAELFEGVLRVLESINEYRKSMASQCTQKSIRVLRVSGVSREYWEYQRVLKSPVGQNYYFFYIVSNFNFI